MFSLKNTVRKTIIAVSLAALTTSFFTGCSNTEVTSSDLYPSSITDEVGTTDTFTDDINPGNKDETHDSNTFSIKYKYWYDNPDVQKAQEETLAQNDPGGDNPDGTTFLGLAGLPLYTDHFGNQYIISGRTIVYLKDGKMSQKDMFKWLRTTGDGERIYVGLMDTVAKSTEKFAKLLATVSKSQPSDYNERIASKDDTEVADSKAYAVYLNNTDTMTTFSSDENCLDISSLLEAYNLGSTNVITADDEATLSLYTAAGELNITFKRNGSSYKVTYSTDEKEQILESDDIIISDAKVFLSLAAIEDYLGYDVEIYDDFINIVTDNKDIVKPENIITDGVLQYTDNTLENNDTTKPADTPENVQAQEDLEEQRKQEEEDAENQAIADLAGKDAKDMTQEDYDALGIIPPGEDPDTYKPATDADGKTAAERHAEAIAEANEHIKNGDKLKPTEANLEAADEVVAERLRALGYSEEEIANVLAH